MIPLSQTCPSVQVTHCSVEGILWKLPSDDRHYVRTFPAHTEVSKAQWKYVFHNTRILQTAQIVRAVSQGELTIH